ncbi:MAG: CPBP family intramembrane glutamic endopeptidase [Pseudomonadota bacterium]
MNTAVASTRPIAQLWIEFLALFVGVPVAMYIWFDYIQERRLLFGLIWMLAIIAFALLLRTPGWQPRDLLKGPVFAKWPMILLFTVLTGAVSTGFVFAIEPSMFLSFVQSNPVMWMIVMVFYPLLSAWPQEVIYRSLFFERYGVLFASPVVLIIANGALFGFGHLFYINWITITMTAFGGAFMGWVYWRYRSMLLAWVIHAIAGQIVFTAGLGRYFYSGAIN